MYGCNVQRGLTFDDSEKEEFLKNIPVEAFKKVMNYLPRLEKKKRSELIYYFLHLVMTRKIWMSFLIVLLMILLMMRNMIKEIQIKRSQESVINKVSNIEICETC